MKFSNMALIAALALTQSAMVMATEPAFTAKVYYGDLDLTSQDGQATLDHRLKMAARHVCSYEGGIAEAVCQKRTYAAAEVTRHQIVAAAVSSKQQLASR